MDFKERVPFGKTGVMVNRIGLASGYGVSSAAMKKAFHEYGINYFYVSPMLNLGSMARAIRILAPDHRDELFIVLARPFLGGLGGLRIERFVEHWLKQFKLEWIDLLLQDIRKPFSPKLADRLQRLKDSGKVRFVGISSHDRPFLGKIARGEIDVPAEFFHTRYNAVHTGAEQDVFLHLPAEDRHGVTVFTATCWRKLLKPKLMPQGEKPLTAADCYRFVLSNPDVDVCLTAPKTEKQMEENFRALEAGPLDEEEMGRARHIGKYIYGK
jgi:aryl-alcohol dehydrogenase-like predicted oxidoreductase